jgi:hypothetical protein
VLLHQGLQLPQALLPLLNPQALSSVAAAAMVASQLEAAAVAEEVL